MQRMWLLSWSVLDPRLGAYLGLVGYDGEHVGGEAPAKIPKYGAK
jgi:hypothetical protein